MNNERVGDCNPRDFTAAEANLKQAQEALCGVASQTKAPPPGQPYGAGAVMCQPALLNPLDLAGRLYQKREYLRQELERVRKAINILEQDETIQKLIQAYQAASPANI